MLYIPVINIIKYLYGEQQTKVIKNNENNTILKCAANADASKTLDNIWTKLIEPLETDKFIQTTVRPAFKKLIFV